MAEITIQSVELKKATSRTGRVAVLMGASILVAVIVGHFTFSRTQCLWGYWWAYVIPVVCFLAAVGVVLRLTVVSPESEANDRLSGVLFGFLIGIPAAFGFGVPISIVGVAGNNLSPAVRQHTVSVRVVGFRATRPLKGFSKAALMLVCAAESDCFEISVDPDSVSTLEQHDSLRLQVSYGLFGGAYLRANQMFSSSRSWRKDEL